MIESINLGSYPYTYVRTVTMKSKLFKKNDYDKLLKMEIHELTKYLQETNYGIEINDLTGRYTGITLLEHALTRNLIASFEKLKRISPDELHALIEVYLKRNDVFNIKTIIRAKFSGMSFDYSSPLLKSGVLFSHSQLQTLFSLEKIDLIIESLGFFDSKEKNSLLNDFHQRNSLLVIENALDKHYYAETFSFCASIKGGADFFKAYLSTEIDVINLKLLLRLKKEGFTTTQILEHIFYFGRELKEYQLLLMLKKDYEHLIPYLLKHKHFGKLIREHHNQLLDKDLTLFEIGLERYLLQKASLLLHQNPLSGEAILGFMLAKDIEVRNVTALIKGKQLEIDEHFLAEQLVVI